jgi:hypothetical protein
MGNGFRNLRANYVAGAPATLAMFSDEGARNLAGSRYLRQAADLTDATDPGILVQAPLRVATGTTSLTVTTHAWDDRALWSVLHYLNLGDTVIGGHAATGTTMSATQICPLNTAFATTASLGSLAQFLFGDLAVAVLVSALHAFPRLGGHFILSDEAVAILVERLKVWTLATFTTFATGTLSRTAWSAWATWTLGRWGLFAARWGLNCHRSGCE